MMYLNRIFDQTLTDYLEAFGAVLTTTAEQQANSVLKMQKPDEQEANTSTAQTKPSILLHGETPRLIDEWQVVPQLWDAVRNEVDERQEVGLCRGSQVPHCYTIPNLGPSTCYP